MQRPASKDMSWHPHCSILSMDPGGINPFRL